MVEHPDSEGFTEAEAEAIKNHQSLLDQSEPCPECDDQVENVTPDFWRPILSCMHPDCPVHINNDEVRLAIRVFKSERNTKS